MGSRNPHKRSSPERDLAIKRFHRQRNLNKLATPGANAFVIVLDHLKPRFNIGKIFRSADAFGARELHLVGIDFFDPAPAMGSFKWVPARFYNDFHTSYEALTRQRYRIFKMDAKGATALTHAQFPERSAFVFGHEEYGFSFDPQDYPDILSISIPQCGTVRCLNVSVAASLTMYEYIRQRKTPP